MACPLRPCTDMMAIMTMRPPWWWFALHGGMDIDNRRMGTSHRGLVALHASKGICDGIFSIDAVRRDFDACLKIWKAAGGPPLPAKRDLHWMSINMGGRIVGVVEIVDVVKSSDSPWFRGPNGYVLRNPVPLDYPILHHPGRTRVRKLDPRIEKQIMSQVY